VCDTKRKKEENGREGRGRSCCPLRSKGEERKRSRRERGMREREEKRGRKERKEKEEQQREWVTCVAKNGRDVIMLSSPTHS